MAGVSLKEEYRLGIKAVLQAHSLFSCQLCMNGLTGICCCVAEWSFLTLPGGTLWYDVVEEVTVLCEHLFDA